MRRIVRSVAVPGVVLGVVLGLVLAGCTSHGSKGSSGSSGGSTSGSVPTSGASSSASPAGSSVGKSGGSAGSGPAGGAVPKGFVPYSATFVSPTLGWLLGTAPCTHKPCTSMLRTRDGGKHWQGIPAPLATIDQLGGTTANRVSTVRFADERNGWAAGTALFATHDGGATWHRETLTSAAGTITSLETASGRVYASFVKCSSSEDCSLGPTVYSASVGSDSWRAISGQLPQGNTRVGMRVRGADWYVPTSGGIYHGQGAAKPVKITNPCPSQGGYHATPQIAVPDPQHLDVMCVGGGAAGSAQYQLYGTSDGGKHWKKAGGKHIEASDCDGIADNAQGVLMVAAASGTSVLLRTTDDGKVLHRISLAVPAGGYSWIDLGFTTTTQAIAVLPAHHFYMSTDKGAHWHVVAL